MLQYDPYIAVSSLRAADKRMARLIDRAGPFTLCPPRGESPFQSLLRAIVSQQLSGVVARAIYGRLDALLPRRNGAKPTALLELSDVELRKVGLSRNKMLAVRDLAAKTLDGTVPSLARLRRMEDEEIVHRLVAVRGIGVWTVEMLLLFRLGRPDVLPVTDLGIRKGFQRIYHLSDLPAAAQITRRAEAWRPFRSVGSWYLWRALELDAKHDERPNG